MTRLVSLESRRGAAGKALRPPPTRSSLRLPATRTSGAALSPRPPPATSGAARLMSPRLPPARAMSAERKAPGSSARRAGPSEGKKRPRTPPLPPHRQRGQAADTESEAPPPPNQAYRQHRGLTKMLAAGDMWAAEQHSWHCKKQQRWTWRP